jgi:hypothetical protein
LDGRPLHWGVHPDGFPIREGDAPPFIDQHQMSQASSIKFFRSKQFRIPEEQEEYVKVMDWIVNKGAVLISERVQDVPNEVGKWIVWLQWVEIRGVIPHKPTG